MRRSFTALATSIAMAVGMLGLAAGPAAADPVVFATIPSGTSPHQVALTPDGSKAYVANGITVGTVAVIDTATNTVLTTIPGFTGPWGVAMAPDGEHAYVSNWGSFFNGTTVSVIDTTTDTIVATISGFNVPRGLAVSPDGTRLYVPDDGSKVSVVDTSTNTIIHTITGVTYPWQVALTPDGTRAYVSQPSTASVTVIDTATNAIVDTITDGTSPLSGVRGIAFTPDGSKAYVTNTQGTQSFNGTTVSVIDTTTNTVTDTIPGFDGPYAAAMAPDGTQAYVVNISGDTMTTIDTATDTIVATTSGLNEPRGIAVTADGLRAYVANGAGSSTSAIALRITAPRAVDATPGNEKLTASWNAPEFTGDQAITGYTATATPGGRTCTTTGATTCEITGLTNGTEYTVTVTATNTIGTSPDSIASDPATPVGPPKPPTAVTATAKDSALDATWTAPGNTGGRPLTGYTATASPGGQTCTTTGATTCEIAGLTNGTAYTVTVTATNELGTSDPSAASDPVTPQAASVAKKVQKPRNAKGKPPKRIKPSGITVLTGRNARTNAGQLIATRVRVRTSTAMGETRYFQILRGPQGKVSIRTFGRPGLKVVLVQSAPATATFKAYRLRTVFTDGVRQ